MDPGSDFVAQAEERRLNGDAHAAVEAFVTGPMQQLRTALEESGLSLLPDAGK